MIEIQLCNRHGQKKRHLRQKCNSARHAAKFFVLNCSKRHLLNGDAMLVNDGEKTIEQNPIVRRRLKLKKQLTMCTS